MKQTVLAFALLLGACGGSDDARVAELEEKIAHLESVAAAERQSYEAQVDDLQERNREVAMQRDRLLESAETAATLVGASGSLEDKISVLSQRAESCEADLERHKAGLDEAVLLLNNMGRRIQLAQLVSGSQKPAREPSPRRQEAPDRPPFVVAHEPYASSTGSGRFSINGEVRNMDDDRVAVGVVEVWLSSDGQKVDSTRIELTVPPREYASYTADLKAPPWEGDINRTTTAYAKWIPAQ